MALTVTHSFVSLEPAKTDPAEVGGADWNANHSLSGTVEVINGGTGATTAADARTSLGLGTIATQNSNNVSITGGSIAGITLTSLDASTTIQDNADPTKQMKFELSGISAGQTRTLTVPDASTTLVGQDTADSLTNKITVDTTNIEVSNLKAKDGTAAGTITDTTGIVTLNSSVLTTTDINGGTIDGVTIGATVAPTVTNLGSVATCDINGGTIDGTTIGGASAAAVTATTLTTTGAIELGNASDTTIARSAAGVVAIEGVEVVTLSRTQELTNKTLNASVGKGTWTASGTWTLPALTLGGNVSSSGNPSLNIGTGALTAGNLVISKSGGTLALLTQTSATGYGVGIVPGADATYEAFFVNNAANTLTNIKMYGNGSADYASNVKVGTYLWAAGVGNAGGLYLGASGSQNGQISQASSGSGTTTTYIGNQAITTSSDIRLKANVVTTSREALPLLKQWEIVDHTWNDPSDQCENNRNSRGVWTGVIAQQVQPITPWLVNKPLEDTNEDGSINPWNMDFGYAVPLLVKAIQELSAKNDALEARLAALEAK